MSVTAKMGSLLLALFVAGSASGMQPREGAMEAQEFVVLAHGNGTLALRRSQITSVWYLAATEDEASQIRVVSPALGDAKTLAGADADELWKTVHDGALASHFVFAPHMKGTLAIPRRQIRTAFYSGNGDQAQLRLVYEGDPSGKTLVGDDATRIWKALTE